MKETITLETAIELVKRNLGDQDNRQYSVTSRQETETVLDFLKALKEPKPETVMNEDKIDSALRYGWLTQVQADALREFNENMAAIGAERWTADHRSAYVNALVHLRSMPIFADFEFPIHRIVESFPVRPASPEPATMSNIALDNRDKIMEGLCAHCADHAKRIVELECAVFPKHPELATMDGAAAMEYLKGGTGRMVREVGAPDWIYRANDDATGGFELKRVSTAESGRWTYILPEEFRNTYTVYEPEPESEFVEVEPSEATIVRNGEFTLYKYDSDVKCYDDSPNKFRFQSESGMHIALLPSAWKVLGFKFLKPRVPVRPISVTVELQECVDQLVIVPKEVDLLKPFKVTFSQGGEK